MSKGYVYILENEAMPGLLKIGKTERNVEKRAAELFQTGVPTPFTVAYQVYCLDCRRIESDVHEVLADHRINHGREFFAVDITTATEALDEAVTRALDELIEDIAPGKVLVDELYAPDVEAIYQIAAELDAYTYEISAAYAELTAEQLRPALELHRRKIEERRASRLAEAVDHEVLL